MVRLTLEEAFGPEVRLRLGLYQIDFEYYYSQFEIPMQDLVSPNYGSLGKKYLYPAIESIKSMAEKDGTKIIEAEAAYEEIDRKVMRVVISAKGLKNG